MSRQTIIPAGKEILYNNYHFAPAVEKNGVIYCSGVIGSGDDLESELRNAWDQIKDLLAAAGADLSDIVEITSYHLDPQGSIAVFSKVKDDYIPDNYPAWTAVGTNGLMMPGNVEIKVTAVK